MASFFAHPFFSVGVTKVLPVVMLNKLAFFGMYKASDNPGIVDVAWTFGHWLAGAVYAYHFNALSHTGGKIMFGLLTLWALRLGGFLLKNRVIPGYTLLTLVTMILDMKT